MNDKCVSISVWVIMAYFAWAATVILILVGIFTPADDLKHVGLATSAAAATISMRCFCTRLGCSIQTAFELGRDVGRAEAVVLPLR